MKYREDKDYSHARAVHKNYGLTAESYRAVHDLQNGRCAICRDPAADTNGKGKRLRVDHDHHTGKVRSLLCASCSTGLGHLKDDPANLSRAFGYLAKRRGT